MAGSAAMTDGMMHSSDRMVTPPMVARYYRVKAEKVLGWIKSGQLRALNVSNGTRPRYRIDPADLMVFEQRRAVVPPAKPVRRRRKRSGDVIEFF